MMLTRGLGWVGGCRCVGGGWWVFRCFNDGAYSQAVGIALEARRLDKVTTTTAAAAASSPRSLARSLTTCRLPLLLDWLVRWWWVMPA